MRACKVDERQLADWIDAATGTIRHLGPAITEKLAQKILAAEKRTGQRNRVLIELDDEMDRNGYGQTAGVRTLHNEGASIERCAGLRVAALTAPGIGVVWSPIAERVDPMERIAVNGIWMEGPEQRELLCWIRTMMGEQEISRSMPERVSHENLFGRPQGEYESDRGQDQVAGRGPLTDNVTNWTGEIRDTEVAHDYNCVAPVKSAVDVCELQEEDLRQVEKSLREHPPRDFQQEKEVEVYQGYIGFIEIHVTGASLSSATTLAIPKELTELGLGDDLRNRLSERMRVDLSDTVDLGARDVNSRVDAFREIFTVKMGQPLGRIYRKSDWEIMQAKWAEIEGLVRIANRKIDQFMHKAVEKTISDAAEEWMKAINQRPDIKSRGAYTLDKIQSRLFAQWDRRQRVTRMGVKLFVKDFTWETLNDPGVREKIEEAYPDLCSTGLYESRRAWAPTQSVER